jgi:hypothetical protein
MTAKQAKEIQQEVIVKQNNDNAHIIDNLLEKGIFKEIAAAAKRGRNLIHIGYPYGDIGHPHYDTSPENRELRCGDFSLNYVLGFIDNNAMRDIIIQKLKNLGYTVSVEASGLRIKW